MNELLTHIKPHSLLNQITQTTLEPLVLYCANAGLENQTYMQSAGLYVVVQGEKVIRIGEQEYCLETGDMMCYFTGLPILTKVVVADISAPYYGLNIKLDYTALASLAEQLPRNEQSCLTPQVVQISPPLCNVLARLTRLLDYPNDVSFLLPLFQAEIYYYLLKSELGGYLRRQLSRGQAFSQINRAIQWVCHHFREPLDVDRLAQEVGMSRSNFYLHFKETTKLTPLQYQKSLRLIEAKRLIKQRKINISAIAFEVGYESASQFSREYSRYFGISPQQERTGG
ncbi:TPA: AraC family transcriptional regulator N-terminal domain-containing protein [Serratia marcescens]